VYDRTRIHVARDLRYLLQAGMNTVRLNFAHGEFAWHKAVIETLQGTALLDGQRVRKPVCPNWSGHQRHLCVRKQRCGRCTTGRWPLYLIESLWEVPR
jgi:hypothetical protein